MCKLHWRLWRWIITTAIHSYDAACKGWKKVCLYVRDFTQTLDFQVDNKIPVGVPGGQNGHLGPLWFEMLPWLKDFNLAKILKDKTILTANVLEKVTHFIQSRTMPPPPLTEKRFDEEVKELREQFSKSPPLSTFRMAKVEKACKRLINYLKKKHDGVAKTRPHLSLSASGKYESARSNGGGAIYAARKYLERYVWHIADHDYIGNSWWGCPIHEKCGIQPYKTVGRESRLQDGIKFLTNSFRDEMAPDELIMTIFSEVNEHKTVEDPLFGLDEAFPHQLLQLAVEENIKSGYIPGPPCEWGDPLLGKDFVRTPVRTKLIAQPESGNKVRFLSEPPTFVTLMLQPFGHWLSDVVGVHPALRSAFSRSMKGWDYAVDLSRNERKLKDGEGLSVYDLSGASNNLNTEFIREVLSRIINAFAKNRHESFFFHQCLGLLLAPRYMIVKRDMKDDKHRVILTEGGVHMSDPGCKPALCLASLVVELMAFEDTLPPPFAIAGDDVANIATREKHQLMIDIHNELGQTIHRTKPQWSQIWVSYCEETIRLIDSTIGCGKPPWKLDYETEDIHIDTFKLRLLMPFSSVDNGMDHERNPMVGKGDALWSQINAHKRPEVINHIKHTFRVMMADYLGKDPIVYLPRIVGGQNVPFSGDREELYRNILDTTGTKIVAIYTEMRYGNEPFPLFGSLTRKMSTGGSSRGLIDPGGQAIIVQYGEICFKQFRDEAKTLEQLKEEFQEKRTHEVSFGEAKRYARRSGYISYAEIADSLDRISAIRMSIACAAGAIDFSEISGATKGERLPSPSEVLNDFIDVEVARQGRSYKINEDLFKTTPEDCQKFKEWILNGNPNFSVRAQGLWVPKRALVDSLNGMTIDMPYQPSRVVPGSEEDQYVGSEFQTPAAFVISRKRF